MKFISHVTSFAVPQDEILTFILVICKTSLPHHFKTFQRLNWFGRPAELRVVKVALGIIKDRVRANWALVRFRIGYSYNFGSWCGLGMVMLLKIDCWSIFTEECVLATGNGNVQTYKFDFFVWWLICFADAWLEIMFALAKESIYHTKGRTQV